MVRIKVTVQCVALAVPIMTDETRMRLELLQAALGRVYHLLMLFRRAVLAVGQLREYGGGGGLQLLPLGRVQQAVMMVKVVRVRAIVVIVRGPAVVVLVRGRRRARGQDGACSSLSSSFAGIVSAALNLELLSESFSQVGLHAKPAPHYEYEK